MFFSIIKKLFEVHTSGSEKKIAFISARNYWNRIFCSSEKLFTKKRKNKINFDRHWIRLSGSDKSMKRLCLVLGSEYSEKYRFSRYHWSYQPAIAWETVLLRVLTSQHQTQVLHNLIQCWSKLTGIPFFCEELFTTAVYSIPIISSRNESYFFFWSRCMCFI